MKIAVLTSGILPVPAVQGGAVENLIDFYLEYNEIHRQHDITVYSIYNAGIHNHPALRSTVNHYHYIRTDTLPAKIRKRILHILCHKNEYYNYHIEYYLHRALQHICRCHYDIVIMENRPGYALKLSKKTMARLVLHEHNDLLNSTTPHHSAISDSLSGIICVSDYISGRICTISGNETKTVTVHNGINATAFSPQADTSVTRASLGLSADDFVIIFSGRINRDKGISELLEAMIRLKDQPHIKLLIIGSPFFGNVNDENDFVRQLKEKAETVRDRVIFTGFIRYSDVPGYLRLADVAVIPSMWNEPFGLTCIEAMAAGLPIVTTTRGGIPEIVSTDNAVTVATGDGFTDRLAKAINTLYTDADRRLYMGEASLMRSQLFTKERFAENFFNAIQRFT